MNWVAVDIGVSYIKASVLDKEDNPIRLLYSMGGYDTTRLSSEVALSDGDKVLLGDMVSWGLIRNPEMKVVDWLHSTTIKSLIARHVFEYIKRAVIKHYSDCNIGLVLLYDDVPDNDLYSVAGLVFDEVRTLCSGHVIKQIISPDSRLMIIADFGAGAFKVSIRDNTNCLYYHKDSSLGMDKVDMLSLIDYSPSTAQSSIEISLLGQIMQSFKIMANNGEDYFLPKDIVANSASIRGKFERIMTTFLYQCFEECTNALNSVSKSWKDMNDILFVGGGANSALLLAAFSKYMQSYGGYEPYNLLDINFDVQYAASHCAIQIPLHSIQEVVIKY